MRIFQKKRNLKLFKITILDKTAFNKKNLTVFLKNINSLVSYKTTFPFCKIFPKISELNRF